MDEFILPILDSDFKDEDYDDILDDFYEKRVVVLNDEIEKNILEKVSLYIIKWNREDKYIPVEKRKPIWIYIQSPGGDLLNGFNLIDIITSSKTPVYGLCFSQCSSMAFHIFITCHKRFAFKNSIFLIHDGSISLANSTSKAKDTMKFFDKIEDKVKEHVLKHSNISSDFYDEIYNKEYYLYADEEGKSLGCVDYIIGDDVELGEIL